MEDTLTLSVRPKPGVVVRACKSSIRGLGGWGAKGQGFNTRFRNIMSLKIVQAPETPPKPLIPVPHIKNVARELYTGNYKTALRATYKACVDRHGLSRKQTTPSSVTWFLDSVQSQSNSQQAFVQMLRS